MFHRPRIAGLKAKACLQYCSEDVHLSAQQIRRFQQRTLEPSEIVYVGDHLEKCASCRERASSSEEVRKAFLAFSADMQNAADKDYFHLSAQHLARYLDDALEDIDRSIADSHLELCDECRHELSELRGLKSSVLPPTDGAGPTSGDK